MNDIVVLGALISARALIERPEWWVSGKSRLLALRAPLGKQRCAGAACADVLGFSDEFLPAQFEIDDRPELLTLGLCMRELGAAIPVPWKQANPGRGIVGYNDDPATTHADIIAVFDTAIGRVRGRLALAGLTEGAWPVAKALANW